MLELTLVGNYHNSGMHYELRIDGKFARSFATKADCKRILKNIYGIKWDGNTGILS